MKLRDLVNLVFDAFDLAEEPKPDPDKEAEQLALRLWLDEREMFVSADYRSQSYADEWQHRNLPVRIGREWGTHAWVWSSGDIAQRKFSSSACRAIDAAAVKAKRDKELRSIADLATAIVERQANREG